MLRFVFTCALLATTLVWEQSARGQQVVDTWRYTLQPPAEGWQQPSFDDEDWKLGEGGFGTPETPGSRVGTMWTTDQIWLRKEIELDSVPDRPALLIHHDEDAFVYINGKQVAELDGFVTEYRTIPIPVEKRGAIMTGTNILAVRCKQTGGGQFIDVHLVDARNVPELPPTELQTKPFVTDLITPWGEEVTAENAWTEYPRPQLKRDNWVNLNGQWQHAVTAESQTEKPSEWDGPILVPFPLESKLSGVQRSLTPNEALWYQRTFEMNPKAGTRQLLNFEAVDHRCEVFVNGESVGRHVGGHTPFTFDITEQVRSGNNELIVRVEDDTEGYQLRGKQVLNPRGIWYTRVSGIWQTVWLEEVPANYIDDLTIRTSAVEGTITVQPSVVGSGEIEITISDGDRVVARRASSANDDGPLTLSIPDTKLWSPSSPMLYDLSVTLSSGDGRDRVQSYAGIRDVGKVEDANGDWRFTLNGEVIFHWGPLDQGWWPDGLLTPPSDEAIGFEIKWLKEAGFNMIRKHIKVEPRRYYYHCDRLGMLVWQDQVSAGQNPPWTRLQPEPVDADWPADAHQQFMLELERMIDTLESHPSIVVWVPFNEAWGQHRTVEVGKWTQQRDPSRLVNIASGGNFWPVGDIVDAHSYPHPEFPWQQGQGGRFDDLIKVMGEFGGHGYPIRDHLWDPDRRNWGYGGLPENEAEYKERYVTSLNKLNQLRQQGIAGGVYTQTTDVEGEINGLMTYDRKVIKIPAEELARLHERLFVPVQK